MVLSYPELCTALDGEIAHLVKVAAAVDLDAPVPTCPAWTAGHLLGHTGGSHRWATGIVRERAQAFVRPGGVPVPREPATVAAWLADGGTELLDVLRATDPDTAVWTWGGGARGVTWWARRQLHETTVHRVDAESALDAAWLVQDAVAVDGVEEFLDNLPYTRIWAPHVDQLRGAGETLLLAGPEVSWLITLDPDGWRWERAGAAAARVTVRGSATDLYLFLWGRRPAADLVVEGDRAVLDLWVRHSAI
ncbi:maleylpyruvate isomerase family mycothiol-dependent enzyme [Longispora sp. NPDC051575]|uniref:maleylpyruvate isomerase family mycothiol-dependent enzyme n=1 Tax=Longispora sp. NPDC051575 TaxID=3154943 RepID=UPI003438F6CF